MMFLDVSVTTATLLVIGHVITAMVAVAAAVREHRKSRRTAWMGAWVFVAFISVVSVMTFLPALNMAIPMELAEALAKVRWIAILFFVLGLSQLFWLRFKCKGRKVVF